ncbi:LOW QUALITY PROTEIN: ATP-binding cassette sub-family D member 3-like [Rhipicephalus sanguineus]|uniref:LOW QUALITY PROTEIN: ATP-binding cassette sub-family D member 3-like n=1 Tax=Rhipicephalus sanguineus TaxID=34632 RepID=UPI00189591C2|nr:LOW QUALITY PROTEIN: ATP-binding cassette sub-family D member 3-like [Rhipicephalus sanguineus]
MAAAWSKLLEQRRPAVVAGTVALIYAWSYFRFLRKQKRSRELAAAALVFDKKDAKKEKAHVDREFFRQLGSLLKVVIPGVFTPEFGYMLLVASSLIGRTLCDIWLIRNGTIIERAIISRNVSLFKDTLQAFIFTMPMLSMVNNLLKYGLSELRLRFRSRLHHALYKEYLSGITYYRMSNLDNRIANPDQLLTQDVEKFCGCLTDLYSNLSKPLLDIVLYVRWLSVAIGQEAPGAMLLYLLFAGVILTRMRRPVGRMTIEEQKLEGELRYVNSRLITNSEEIAFYQGNDRERITLDNSFRRLVQHLRDFLEYRFTLGIVDDIVAKYLATVVGYLLISRPFMAGQRMQLDHNQRLEEYYKSGRMLVKLAESVGRVVLAGREMTRLAGFTARVSQLRHVLHDLARGHYVRSMLAVEPAVAEEAGDTSKPRRRMELVPGAGRIITRDNIIRFQNVPLVTPNGDVLVDDLSIEVRSGVNVLVCGPNGCGKSSLFRILGELWPLFGGTLVKPAKEKLFYIPQRPYMTLGTLRDQVIYPDSHLDMLRRGVTDEQLARFLHLVQLDYVLERERGWDTIQDWMDILSGGEKQRIAMARLFYRQPQFAILDECTSAVSVDVEGSMYQYCRQAGITLFTVSHRKSLWKYHEYCLYMDGRGSYEFKPITPDTKEFGS